MQTYRNPFGSREHTSTQLTKANYYFALKAFPFSYPMLEFIFHSVTSSRDGRIRMGKRIEIWSKSVSFHFYHYVYKSKLPKEGGNPLEDFIFGSVLVSLCLFIQRPQEKGDGSIFPTEKMITWKQKMPVGTGNKYERQMMLQKERWKRRPFFFLRIPSKMCRCVSQTEPPLKCREISLWSQINDNFSSTVLTFLVSLDWTTSHQRGWWDQLVFTSGLKLVHMCPFP